MCWEPVLFLRELKRSGIRVTTDWEDEGITCVLVSYDNQLTYERLADTCRILMNPKVDYLATNPDFVCPVEFGYVPDCGSICEMLEHAVKRMPYFIGKPETAMVEFALPPEPVYHERRLWSSETACIRIFSAVIMPAWRPALVLTGEATAEEAEEGGVSSGLYFSIDCRTVSEVEIMEVERVKAAT